MMEKGWQFIKVIMIFIDLSKVYDSVEITGLLSVEKGFIGIMQ